MSRRMRSARATKSTASPAAGAPAPRPTKSIVREYFESIVVAVILALFVRTWVLQAFKIPTGSMENNLLIGDHLLVNKMVFAPAPTPVERALLPLTDIARGDVVVFKYPEEPERDFIKRVIGLPGETIELRERRVYVDGRPLDEPYVLLLPELPGEDAGGDDVRVRYGPVEVPADHYFMMGDNRDNSQDSRYWGFLPRRYVKGRALMIYWSFEGDPAWENRGLVGRVLLAVPDVFRGTRWRRLLHQIH
jgi:signal peptidase I